MKLLKSPEQQEEFSPAFKREFVEKIVIKEMTLSDLAAELGLPPELLRKWTMKVGRDERTWTTDEQTAPAIRILELQHDIEDLKREVHHQANTIRILENRDLGIV